MDTQTYKQTHNIDGDRIPMHTSEAQFKDAMRYRRLKFFLDTLVIMDKDKGSLHFTDGADFDKYIDNSMIGKGPLTAKDITAHALDILSNQLSMTYKESKK